MSVNRIRGALFTAIALAPLVPLAARAQAQPAAIQQARLDSIRRPYVKADIEFMSGMIGHHAQAVKMANWAPSHGANKSLQIYCARVAMAQTAEIGLMQQWLRERSLPTPDADARGMKMDMGGEAMFMRMPGMLTDAQMAQLDSARGVDFDRLFLTYMIQHHRGALEMVDTLTNSPGADQDETVFKFSNDVHADQSTEIDRMQQMLDALPSPTTSKKKP